LVGGTKLVPMIWVLILIDLTKKDTIVQIEIVQHIQSRRIELYFSELPPQKLVGQLLVVGFKKIDKEGSKWYADNRPAYHNYAKELQQALLKNSDWQHISLSPSYTADIVNIYEKRFSIVNYIFPSSSKITETFYVIFEPIKVLATFMASEYVKSNYKVPPVETIITPRNKKDIAKNLFEKGKVIHAITKKEAAILQQKPSTAIVATTKPSQAEISDSQITNNKEKEEEKKEAPLAIVTTPKEVITPQQKDQSETEKTAKITELGIDFPKKAKYEARITIAKMDQDGYSFGLQYRKLFGDFSGVASPYATDGDVFSSYTSALKAGFETLYMRVYTSLNQKDTILNNEKSKTNITTHVLNSIIASAQKQGIILQTLDHSKPLRKASNPKKNTATPKKRIDFDQLLSDVIQKLQVAIAETAALTSKAFLSRLMDMLLDASDQEQYNTQLQLVKKAIQSYRDQYSSVSSDKITFQMLRLMECLGEAPLSQTDKITTPKLISQQEVRDNLIIPKGIGKHFAFHNFKLGDAEFLQEQYPHLLEVNDASLDTTKATSLFELMQLPHPTDYGFAVHRGILLSHFEQNGMEIFKELDLPTSIDYPYINIHTQYRSVQPLKDIIGLAAGKRHWWSLATNYRPIKDIAIALDHIEAALAQSKAEQQCLINPKTQKPKKKNSPKYEDIAYHISRLEQSKDQLLTYKKAHDKTAIPAKTAPAPNGYLCSVVATMHQFYAQKQRLTKKQIEALQHPTHTPTLGKLWEAMELSWLLWYRQLYVQFTPFDSALKAMIHFWNTVQPTYAYSDSSKERFKQYSTPCIIGAMLAQYTQMDRAERIFEPSAGNGLLLVGADPEKTIVNEIDPTRRDSLTEQQFKEVHAKNAAAPFPKAWKKHFDVVVTNPPFAKWEDELFDKKRVVSKYFNKHHELARYMRLEHYMAGLALHTLKDTGKAAIIIMGHLYFDDQGYIAKYAPFYKWLSRHYIIDDIINLNGFKIYAKQGAVARTMLILIGGRKTVPTSNFPTQQSHPHFDTIVDSFEALWMRIKAHIDPLEKIIKQLKIATS